MEKIISVKDGRVAEKDGKEWVELTDNEDKIQRVFPSIQKEDGTWIRLDKEIDMLKSKIENKTIQGLALKLTKEKKGQYWNIIKVEEVKNVFVEQAQKQVEDKTADARDRSISLSYAVWLAQTGVIYVADIFDKADEFVLYMKKGIKPEVTMETPVMKPKEQPSANIIEALEKEGIEVEVESEALQPQNKPIEGTVDSKPLNLKNAGELATALKKKVGKKFSVSEACVAMSVNSLSEIDNLDEAFNTICGYFEKKGG